MSATVIASLLLDGAKRLEATAQRVTLSAPNSSLPQNCRDRLTRCTAFGQELRAAASLVEARQSAHEAIDGLLSIADKATNRVALFGKEMAFASARYLAFSGYLSTTWSICDKVCNVVGRLICHPEVANNPANSPQLWQHFTKAGTHIAGHHHEILKGAYGWPIGVAYAVRNHFVHDGALHIGKDFFEGPGVSDAYRISGTGWTFLEEKVRREYKLTPNQTRVIQPWPWFQEDLLKLLWICHQELDEALGLLAEWAISSVSTQADYLLRRDVPS